MRDEYEFPKWEEAGRVHDWRNYISDELQGMWESFTPEQRRAIGRNAQGIADNEEWE